MRMGRVWAWVWAWALVLPVGVLGSHVHGEHGGGVCGFEEDAPDAIALREALAETGEEEMRRRVEAVFGKGAWRSAAVRSSLEEGEAGSLGRSLYDGKVDGYSMLDIGVNYFAICETAGATQYDGCNTEEEVRTLLDAVNSRVLHASGVNVSLNHYEAVVDAQWFSEGCKSDSTAHWKMYSAKAPQGTAKNLHVYGLDCLKYSLYGFAYMPVPDDEDWSGYGIYMDWRTLPGYEVCSGMPCNGATFVHELGHYLGLDHTFYGGCGDATKRNYGDAVADTPPVAEANWFCPAGYLNETWDPALYNSCYDPFFERDGDVPDDVLNYMDYTADACKEHFTPQQIGRMMFTAARYRPTLVASSRENDSSLTCIPGTFYDEDADRCEYCPSGHYQNEHGSTACKACPEDALYNQWIIGMESWDRCFFVNPVPEGSPTPAPVTTCISAGGDMELFGNGRCDARNNIPECWYDYGDCCQSTCRDGDTGCEVDGFPRVCLDPRANDNGLPDPDECVLDWIADGVCDPENNNEQCTWDGGDCCCSTCIQYGISGWIFEPWTCEVFGVWEEDYPRDCKLGGDCDLCPAPGTVATACSEYSGIPPPPPTPAAPTPVPTPGAPSTKAPTPWILPTTSPTPYVSPTGAPPTTPQSTDSPGTTPSPEDELDETASMSEIAAVRIVAYVVFNISMAGAASSLSLTAEEVKVLEASIAAAIGLSDDLGAQFEQVQVQCICGGADVCPVDCMSVATRFSRALQEASPSSLAVKYQVTLPKDEAKALGGANAIASTLSETAFLSSLQATLVETGQFPSAALSSRPMPGPGATVEAVVLTVFVCSVIEVPAHGQLGTCADPLRYGQSCSIECDAGWKVAGVMECGPEGELIALASCEAEVPLSDTTEEVADGGEVAEGKDAPVADGSTGILNRSSAASLQPASAAARCLVAAAFLFGRMY